ncbi:MAG: hypothetical protein JWM75_994 [Sphingomonas bacterium]|nr:hypothetical protein [Sphingomonas bacterium]
MASGYAMLAAALVAGATPAAASDYVLIRKEIAVARSADAVWARIGGYCAIAEWLKLKCEMLSGKGDVGTVRQLNGEVEEPMVARTARSYTYGQTKGAMAAFAYHGTLAVEPAGTGSSRIVYTLFYDAALMASDEMRKSQFDRLGARFQGAIEQMKTLSEAQG